jgi:hypothetical protein
MTAVFNHHEMLTCQNIHKHFLLPAMVLRTRTRSKALTSDCAPTCGFQPATKGNIRPDPVFNKPEAGSCPSNWEFSFECKTRGPKKGGVHKGYARVCRRLSKRGNRWKNPLPEDTRSLPPTRPELSRPGTDPASISGHRSKDQEISSMADRHDILSQRQNMG